MLHLYLTAARYGRTVAPRLAAMIKSEKIKTPAVLSPDASQLFLELLKTTGKLGEALRGLHENGVLEAVLPCFQHIRCLLQFNQYHHYTVDEHTLRAIEAAEGFLGDTGAVDGPIGKSIIKNYFTYPSCCMMREKVTKKIIVR